ncbi:hypothetical protein [Mycolicibacterium llatzerense]|uniref:hypothetical protein n=1 Tax=Mycolicibacterium llatzerense TaxID=280871 RepID=UPI0021B5AEE3|nr:hypothetical protein [Mycolicibacterium llatzerense]MCT7372992.1 hypothetical protein [Mycolicibacterium llatzerense]
MSGMDGARAGARRMAHRKITHECACGRVLYGNLATSHLRSCEQNLRVNGWPIDAGMRDALLREYSGRRYVEVLTAVERGLGRIYLDRRAGGDKSPLPWLEYRDTIWRLAEEAAR